MMRAHTAALWLVGAAGVLMAATVAHAQRLSAYMVLEPLAPCRVDPEAGARVIGSARLGITVWADRDTTHDNTQWYSAEAIVSEAGGRCWLDARSVIRVDGNRPGPALELLTERALDPKTPWAFADLVAAENVLIGPYRSALQRSGLLQFRRLLIIARANRVPSDGAQDPLREAWVLAHSEYLADDPFGGGSYALSQPYWNLFEKFKKASWADELAWKAAQLTPPTDECYSECVLSFHILRGPVQYWRRLPRGTHVEEALTTAIASAKYATDLACYDRKTTRGSRSESPVPLDLTATIRNSLLRVTALEKRELLKYLKEAEDKCR